MREFFFLIIMRKRFEKAYRRESRLNQIRNAIAGSSLKFYLANRAKESENGVGLADDIGLGAI